MFAASLMGQYSKNFTSDGEVERPPVYMGGLGTYMEKCEQVVEAGYEGFVVV